MKISNKLKKQYPRLTEKRFELFRLESYDIITIEDLNAKCVGYEKYHLELEERGDWCGCYGDCNCANRVAILYGTRPETDEEWETRIAEYIEENQKHQQALEKQEKETYERLKRKFG